MKILYALQGTGNGHIARAQKILPTLSLFGDLDVFVSGSNSQLNIGNYSIRAHQGLSLFYNKKGEISYKKMIKSNCITSFIKEVNSFPIDQYDLILNDFEPITAYAAKLKGKQTIGLSHQASLLFDETPKVKNFLGENVIKYYAPTSSTFGFHFKRYNQRIHLPIIRDRIRNLETKNEDYFIVYLPSYHHDEIVDKLSKIKDAKWKIFSPFCKEKIRQHQFDIYPIDERIFMIALANCNGVLCGAGFELPSEALYLKKKLFVIPIKGQYEQLCNSIALKDLGIDYSLEFDIVKLQKWVDSGKIISVDYPDQTDQIIIDLVSKYV